MLLSQIKESIMVQENKYYFKDLIQWKSRDHSPTILMVKKIHGYDSRAIDSHAIVDSPLLIKCVCL